MAFSPIDVLHLFQKNNNIFTNREGLTFEMPVENLIRVTTSLRSPCQEGCQVPMLIRASHYGLYPFLYAYRINSLHFIKQKFSSIHLYEQYYESGRGQVICSLTRMLGMPPHQRVDLIVEHMPLEGGVTKVYSPQLYFFEELNEGFYEDEQYVDYIQKHRPLFDWLLSSRSTIQFGKNLGSDECRN